MPGYQTYARTEVQTSDPRAVVVLLYEGLVNFLNQGAACAREDRRSDMSVYVGKALKIVRHLSASLDFENGGEVAENLLRLYNFMRDSLLEANVSCDAEKIEDVVRTVKPLLEAWREVAQDPAAAQALENRPQFVPAPEPFNDVQASGTEPPNARGARSAEAAPALDIRVGDEVSNAGASQPDGPRPRRSGSTTAAGRSAYGIPREGR